MGNLDCGFAVGTMGGAGGISVFMGPRCFLSAEGIRRLTSPCGCATRTGNGSRVGRACT